MLRCHMVTWILQVMWSFAVLHSDFGLSKQPEKQGAAMEEDDSKTKTADSAPTG